MFDGKNPVLQLEVLEPEKPHLPGAGPEQLTKLDSPTKPEQPTKTGLAASESSIRTAAEWALGVGIVLKVESGGTTSDVQNLSDLPPDPLVVQQLTVPDHVRAPTDDWRHLAAFEGLKEFYATGPGVNDEALTFVGQLPKLELVDLTRTRVTDVGLAKLAGLNTLKTIRIAGTEDARVNVTDAAGATFLKIPSLQTLNLNSCRITDAIVPQIARLPALRDLYLYSNPIYDAEIPTLKALKLSRLGLGSTKITDASADAFNEMTALTSLILNSTAFSDEGLSRLTSLNLDSLYVVRCPISQDALKKWMSANPQTEVSVEYGVTISGSSTPQPGKPTQPDAPTTVIEIPETFAKSTDPVVQAVGWALSRRFELTLKVGDDTVKTSSFESLPDDDYVVTGLSVTGPNASSQNDWQHLVALAPKLEELTISGAKFDDAAPLNALAEIDAIERLRISNVAVKDEWLQPIGRMSNLRILSLSSTGTTEVGVAHLKGLKLTELDLSGNPLTDTVSLAITEIKPLASLNLSRTEVGDPSCKQLVNLPRLRSLNLSQTKVTDVGLASLAAAKKLAALSLDKTAISNAGLSSLTKLRLLRELSIKSTQCSVAGVDDFRKKNDKCKLAYSPSKDANPSSSATTASTPPVFAPLKLEDGIPEAFLKSENPEIQATGWMISRDVHVHITFQENGKLSQTSVRTFSDVPNAPLFVHQVTVVSSASVGKDDWDFLRALTNLKQLTIITSEFDDSALGLIAGHPKLESVDLRNCSISDAGIAHLARMPAIIALTVGRTQETADLPVITDEAVNSISRLRRLGNLQLLNTDISNNGLARLVNSLQNIYMLGLQGGQITDVGVANVTRLRRLNYLTLQGSNFSDDSLRVAASIPELSTLIMNSTSITNAGLRVLAGHPKLGSLYLRNSAIGDAGLVYLRQIPKLSTLFLSGTEVSNAGLQTISQMKALQIHLNDTNVTLEAVQAFQNARPDMQIQFTGVKRPNSN